VRINTIRKHELCLEWSLPYNAFVKHLKFKYRYGNQDANLSVVVHVYPTVQNEYLSSWSRNALQFCKNGIDLKAIWYEAMQQQNSRGGELIAVIIRLIRRNILHITLLLFLLLLLLFARIHFRLAWKKNDIRMCPGYGALLSDSLCPFVFKQTVYIYELGYHNWQ